MAPAQVLNFRQESEPYISVPNPERFRKAMHEELDKFLDQLMGVFEKESTPSLDELSDLVTRVRGGFLGSCLQHLIEEKYSAALKEETSPCPQCGKICKRRREVSKKLQTMQGPFEVHRPWFYCSACRKGFIPFVGVAEISRKEKQFDIQKRAVELSAHLPFECASGVFENLTGQKVSDHFIHDLFEEI